MSISLDAVKEIREKTGLGVMDCRKALEEAGGDKDKALEILRLKGARMVEKKADRETKAGAVGSYIHLNGKIGVLIEINCESDFVAKTDDFKELLKNLSLQIAATNPAWLDREAVPQDILDEQKQIITEQHKGKPEKVLEKIVQGKQEDFFKQNVLLDQLFIKDDSKTIKGYVGEKVAKLGENIKVRRFVRFELNN